MTASCRLLVRGHCAEYSIVELRAGENLSAEEIAGQLTARERLPVSATTVARTLFRKAVRASATNEITPHEIVVSLGWQAQNPLLLQTGYRDLRHTIP